MLSGRVRRPGLRPALLARCARGCLCLDGSVFARSRLALLAFRPALRPLPLSPPSLRSRPPSARCARCPGAFGADPLEKKKQVPLCQKLRFGRGWRARSAPRSSPRVAPRVRGRKSLAAPPPPSATQAGGLVGAMPAV